MCICCWVLCLILAADSLLAVYVLAYSPLLSLFRFFFFPNIYFRVCCVCVAYYKFVSALSHLFIIMLWVWAAQPIENWNDGIFSVCSLEELCGSWYCCRYVYACILLFFFVYCSENEEHAVRYWFQPKSRITKYLVKNDLLPTGFFFSFSRLRLGFAFFTHSFYCYCCWVHAA